MVFVEVVTEVCEYWEVGVGGGGGGGCHCGGCHGGGWWRLRFRGCGLEV